MTRGKKSEVGKTVELLVERLDSICKIAAGAKLEALTGDAETLGDLLFDIRHDLDAADKLVRRLYGLEGR